MLLHFVFFQVFCIIIISDFPSARYLHILVDMQCLLYLFNHSYSYQSDVLWLHFFLISIPTSFSFSRGISTTFFSLLLIHRVLLQLVGIFFSTWSTKNISFLFNWSYSISVFLSLRHKVIWNPNHSCTSWVVQQHTRLWYRVRIITRIVILLCFYKQNIEK